MTNQSIRERAHTPECEHPIWQEDEPRQWSPAWADWAEEKGKTHDQQKCEHCGLWIIWVPRPYPVDCVDCGAQVGEPCMSGCPNLDPVGGSE